MKSPRPVGDDDQSIYAFRGALVGNMADFQREFHVERLIRLEQNYRSSSHILDTANALIARITSYTISFNAQCIGRLCYYFKNRMR